MRYLQLVLVLFILFLAACTDSGTPSPTDTLTLELPQFFESNLTNGATVSVNYPADWGIQVTVPDFGIALMFPEDLTSTIDTDSEVMFESGQVQVFVIFSSKSDLAAILENSTAVGLLETFLSNVDSSVGEVGEIESKTLDGRESATVLLSESSGDSYAVVIDAGEAFVVLTGTFASGELGQYQETIEAIAISTSYTAASEEATAEATETD